MSTVHKPRNRNKNINALLTRCGLFAVGAVLGLTYYRKKYKPFLKKNNLSTNKVNTNYYGNNDVEIPQDIDEWLKIALNASYSAGDLIKEFINNKKKKSESMLTKSNAADIATQIDKKCEEIILSAIKSSFPSHKIIAEESCLDPNSHEITNEPTWFIDPIDGTTNFLHGLAYVGVCIGLRINKIAILGVVHFPILNETFYAILNKGSYLIDHKNNNKQTKLQTNTTSFDDDNKMKNAFILTEIGYDRSEKYVNCVNRRFYDLLYKKRVRGIRMLGTCAANMCSVACGRADVFYEGRNYKQGPKPWDFTAAEIIVHEAGGISVLPDGRQFDCTQGRILCCNNVATAQYLVDMKLYKDSDALE